MKHTPFPILVILLLSILSCRNSPPKRIQHSDPFYNDTGEGKFLVVPLIEPYRAVSDVGAGIGWQMDLYENYPINTDILRIEKIAVQQSVIMVFAPNNPSMDSSRPDIYPIWHWVVIIPEQKIEVGFASEEDFLKYVQEFGINEPNWVSPLDAFKQFEKTGCLEWIPDCE